MKTTIIFSALLGLFWGVLAMMLMGDNGSGMARPSTWIASLAAGALAGWHTVWSRQRRQGRESLLHGLANYYLALLMFWFALMVGWQIEQAWEQDWWEIFDLFEMHDRLGMLVVFFIYGSVPYGVVLIPMAFASRQMTWVVHQHTTAARQF